MILKTEMGICDTCRFYKSHEYDPSPSGVALSPGTIIEKYCELIETGKDENIPDNESVGTNSDNQCPCWQPAIDFCKKHNTWYSYQCPGCEEETNKQLEEIYGKEGRSC
jgi:hypothetical protein